MGFDATMMDDEFIDSDQGLSGKKVHRSTVTKSKLNDNIRGMIDIAGRFSSDSSSLISGRVIAFGDVENQAILFASIIRQAIDDSMPKQIFTEKSSEQLFSSLAHDSYDAFNFMTTNRLDVYCNLIGINPEIVRADWRKEYSFWVEESARNVVENIKGRIIHLLSHSEESSIVHVQTKAFTRSVQFDYWASAAKIDPSELRASIASGVVANLKQKAEEEEARLIAASIIINQSNGAQLQMAF